MTPTLMDLLASYDREIYPFHMPGHKRRLTLPEDAYKLDITEIEGFDDLHHPAGVLEREQGRLADLAGARQSMILVNGSTCGILAAISAAVPCGGKILIARNSHKSAYHALYLRQIYPFYVYPALSKWGIPCQITPDDISCVLDEDDGISAVYVTSPTYDGIVSDIEAIAGIAHSHGKPLIVDEAHGAHFGMHGMFPNSAVSCGADVVVQSLHKTLPAFTQSAVLHVCSDRIDPRLLREYLDIYESSSPSYVLMAGISRMIDFLNEQGEARFERLYENLGRFYEMAANLKRLHVIRAEDLEVGGASKDPSKILIGTRGSGIDGLGLYHRLLREYKLQLEMYSPGYATALCSLMDTDEGFERLFVALREIDGGLSSSAGGSMADEGSCGGNHAPTESVRDVAAIIGAYSGREQVCAISEAADAPWEHLPISRATGRVSAEYAYLYPPGIPMIAPGERVDDAFVHCAEELARLGMKLEGLRETGMIRVMAGQV